MTIIKIVSDLVSQLHKYAIMRALALKYNTEFKFDISWYNNVLITTTVRKYQLNKCNIDAYISGFSCFFFCLKENLNKILIFSKTWIKNDELNNKFLKTMKKNYTIFIDSLK